MLFWLSIAYCLLIALLYLFQNNIIFQPISLKDDYRFRFEDTFEEIWLKTEDSLNINALYFQTKKPKNGAILYLHGNSGNLQRWAKHYSDFTERGYDFLAIDYRGYGKSEGKPSEKGLYKDATAAYNWLKNRYPEDSIIIYGRSLGTGVACELTTRVNAQKLILETPFNSIHGAINHSAPMLWLPFAPRSLFPNEQYLAKVKEPVYIIQGTQDRVVPYASAAKLKHLLKDDDAFFVIEGGQHRNLSSFPED